ncbi:sulfotransferase domain-containing protein [Microcoleus sp. S36b_A4]|uniref:sulfotransferase domain-containing protein n=1 Tax=Microcoleus sp. S36b_A4 TaxID=3055420 RepID=UPI002FD01455
MTTNPSIIWFTTHKCASVYATEILQKLAHDLGMTYVNYEGNLWEAGQSLGKLISSNDPEKINNMFKTTGHIYGPFRQYYPISEMEKYKVIVMLRDPRDVLTSLYFSIAYSHGIPESQKTKIEAAMEDARNKNIDDLVLEHSPWLSTKYNQYEKYLLAKKNVLLLKYEDMVTDFPVWLSEMFKHLAIKPSEQLRKELIDEAKFEVKEDIYSHKRQVKPGDHRRKLQVNTIKQLNLELQDILKIHGWVSNQLQEEDELFQLNLERSREKLEKFKFGLEQAKQQITSD